MDKKNIFVFDTEDNARERIKNPILTPKMTVGGISNGDYYFEFKNYAQFIELIPETKEPLMLFCHNSDYDIGNIFRNDLDKIEIYYIKSRFIFAKLKERKAIICDSFNHWKASLDKMGEMIGLPKLPFDPDSFEYRKRDCDVLFLFFKKYAKLLREYNTEIGVTLPSTAMKIWKNNFTSPYVWKNKLTNEDKDYIRKSYTGGRVEIFKHGYINGKIRSYDINSLYPSVMRDNSFPLPRSFVNTPNLNYPGVTTCTVKSEMKIPILPHSIEGKLLFPNGTFSGTWTNLELNYFQQSGGEILKIHKGIHFTESVRPFTEFVTHFYNKRLKCTDKVTNTFYKMMLNSLYGKFAQKSEGEVLRKIESGEYYEGLYITNDRGEKYGVVHETRNNSPQHANVIWASYVTAYGRIKLHKYLALNAENLVYCDTDSVITIDKTMHTSDQLGMMKLEESGTQGLFILPKLYFIWNNKIPDGLQKYATKGFSVSKTELLPFLFYDSMSVKRRPIRLRSAVMLNLPINTWYVNIKRIVSTYNKRKVLSDGRTIPITIKERLKNE